jgi:hypothetical protein
MKSKKLYQVIQEEQIIATILATTVERCSEYLIANAIVDDLNYVTILEVAKDEKMDDSDVFPLMVAKKYSWYDLRHHSNHLYIYEDTSSHR